MNYKKHEGLFEASKNKFYINILEENNLQNITALAKKNFLKYSNIDTILTLVPKKKDTFYFYVIERDGSFSEMCGNGARAAFYFLENFNLINPNKEIHLITKNKHQVKVKPTKIEGKKMYQVGMGFVPSFKKSPEDFTNILDINDNKIAFDFNFDRIKKEISNYLKDSTLLESLFPKNSPINEYKFLFKKWLKILYEDEEKMSSFKKLCSHIKIRDLFLAGGEPHLILELVNFKKNLFSQNNFDFYLKCFSFLWRFQKNRENKLIFPQSSNIMFFLINSQKKIYMYPAERGVYNQDDYDQTGACGTGSTSLGCYLLTKDSYFKTKEKVKIINRSGDSLIVKKDSENNFYLIGEASES